VTEFAADELTGFTRGRAALMHVGGVLLTEHAANMLAAALVIAVAPVIKAEALADVADDLAEMAHHFGEHEPTGLALNHLAHALDSASAQIREATR
jgi:hypothetical protein